jgi:hypothetical protein
LYNESCMNPNFSEEKKFTNSNDELEFLRSRVASLEKNYAEKGEDISREEIIREEIDAYKKTTPEEALHRDFALTHSDVEGIVLDLSPEEHDKKIEELLGILQEKGILNTIQIVEALKNPHIEDDFHRFLVEYVGKGYPVDGLKEKTPLYKALKRILYEISFPDAEADEKQKPLKEFVSGMEQLYAGLLNAGGIDSFHDYITIELAQSHAEQETVFYMSLPVEHSDLFEKQVLSFFPKAKVLPKHDDYNIFNEGGITSGSYASYEKSDALPIKTYEEYDHDPLNALLNSFSKMNKVGEGASIQIVLNPHGDFYLSRFKKALEQVEKGKSKREALDIPYTFLGELRKDFKSMLKDSLKVDNKKKEKDAFEQKYVDQGVVESLKKKVSSPIVSANIRILASAENRARAESIRGELESTFSQFVNTTGNSISFTKCEGTKLNVLVRNFSFRYFIDGEVLPMSIREVTTVMHFPAGSYTSNPILKQAKAGTAPAPSGMPDSGILLGENIHQNTKQDIYMIPEDRLRHMYVIGQTGTGKSVMLKNMIIQDMKNGEGVCFIDPHGSDVEAVLACVPPERYEDVIYFDPAYTDRPMALNMLEFDQSRPDQKTFVVNELFSIFKKLFSNSPESMGPAFEQYFRNSAMLVMEHPESGCTLVDISRVLSDKKYRDFKLAHCKNPLVAQFWANAEKTTGDQGIANYVPYITNKFDVFLSNEIMRPIISQEKSSFNFRDLMDNKKILLVNLSKGRLGDMNANLIGLILVGKILMAALSRADIIGRQEFPPFYLYIDEFHNITSDSIATILSEARKYKLGLTIANQYIKQIDEGIRDAVFGNVGSMAVFRVSVDDAEYLVKQFEPVFTAKDIMNVDNLNAYMKILSQGKPVRPFSLFEPFPPKGDIGIGDKLKQLSYLTYGQDRSFVEDSIMEKYNQAI